MSLGLELTRKAQDETRAKAEAMKERMIAGYTRMLDHDPRGIAKGDLSRVLAIVREHGTMRPELETELLRRLASGRLGPVEQTQLLGLSETLAASVVRRLAQHPTEAMSVLNHAQSTLDWPEPTFTEETLGPPHARNFEVVAGLVLAKGTYRTTPVRDRTLKGARQQAVIHLIAQVAGVMPPGPRAVVPVVDPPAVGKTRSRDPTSNRENAKSYLQELCGIENWPLPVYTTTGRARITGRALRRASGSARRPGRGERARAAAAVARMREGRGTALARPSRGGSALRDPARSPARHRRSLHHRGHRRMDEIETLGTVTAPPMAMVATRRRGVDGAAPGPIEFTLMRGDGVIARLDESEATLLTGSRAGSSRRTGLRIRVIRTGPSRR